MTLSRRNLLALTLVAPVLVACGRKRSSKTTAATGETPEMTRLIEKWAAIHGIPESLLRRQIKRESSFNPSARNGPYYGLLQVLPQTAQTMGYSGPAEGLLDAETNLKYAGRYLRGAWLVAEGNEDAAMMWFAKGYYYEAKRKGLLRETGLKS